MSENRILHEYCVCGLKNDQRMKAEIVCRLDIVKDLYYFILTSVDVVELILHVFVNLVGYNLDHIDELRDLIRIFGLRSLGKADSTRLCQNKTVRIAIKQCNIRMSIVI